MSDHLGYMSAGESESSRGERSIPGQWYPTEEPTKTRVSDDPASKGALKHLYETRREIWQLLAHVNASIIEAECGEAGERRAASMIDPQAIYDPAAVAALQELAAKRQADPQWREQQERAITRIQERFQHIPISTEEYLAQKQQEIEREG